MTVHQPPRVGRSLARIHPIHPPDDIDPAVWEALSDGARAAWHDLSTDDRWHLLDAAQARARIDAEPIDEQRARIDAKADSATMAALDRLRCNDPGDDVAIFRFEGSSTKNRDTSCGSPHLGRMPDGRLITTWLRCKRRTCVKCSTAWSDTKLTDLLAIIDRLSGGDLDAPPVAIRTEVIHEDDWRATSTRIRRHGSGWLTVPLPEDRRLIVTDDETIGAPRPALAAVDLAAQALAEVSQRPNDRRQVRFSKDWRELADVGRIDADDLGDDITWLGIATKADTPAKVATAAKRAGGIAAPVASADDPDPTASTTWVAKIPPKREWQFLAIIGFRPYAELATERAARRFEAWQRRQARRRPARHVAEVAA